MKTLIYTINTIMLATVTLPPNHTILECGISEFLKTVASEK